MGRGCKDKDFLEAQLVLTSRMISSSRLTERINNLLVFFRPNEEIVDR